MPVETVDRSFLRPALVASSTAAALLANLAGFSADITVVFPHLFYIPIVLAGYWYPRRGPLLATGIAAVYAVPALAFAPSMWLSIASRAVTLIAIGTLIAFLSRRLAAEEARYHGLFENSVAGILIVDGDGAIQGANPQAAALVGRVQDTLPGTLFARISSNPDQAAEFVAEAARVPVGPLEFAMRHSDGRLIHCLVSGAPLEDGRIVVTLADVTGQYLARSALQSANRTMATLARILDQDLTADLAALDTYLERERASVDDPEAIALLREIGDQVNAIARRVTVAREFNALGTAPPLWHSLEAAVETARGGVDAGPVAIRPWVARLELYADPALPSAIQHLLHNATRPAIKASRVVITYHHGPDGCRIYIEDDGTGFPLAERAVLTTRGDPRDRHGLSFVRETLGITGIVITEEGTGTGARFVLSVPPEECRVV